MAARAGSYLAVNIAPANDLIRAQAPSHLLLCRITGQHSHGSGGLDRLEHLERIKPDGPRPNDERAIIGFRGMFEHGMNRDGNRLGHQRLILAELVRQPHPLRLVGQHVLGKPAATVRGKLPLVGAEAQGIVPFGTGRARLEFHRRAVRKEAQITDLVSSLQSRHRFACLHHFTINLVAEKNSLHTGDRGNAYPRVDVKLEKMHVAAAQTARAHAHLDPLRSRQIGLGQLSHTQGRQGPPHGALVKTAEDLGERYLPGNYVNIYR